MDDEPCRFLDGADEVPSLNSRVWGENLDDSTGNYYRYKRCESPKKLASKLCLVSGVDRGGINLRGNSIAKEGR